MDIDTIVMLVMAAGTTLAGTIGILFRTVMSMGKDHQKMLREHGDMKQTIGQLQGERKGIERLSADVIEVVYKVLGRHKPSANKEVDEFRNDTSIDRIKRDLDL